MPRIIFKDSLLVARLTAAAAALCMVAGIGFIAWRSAAIVPQPVSAQLLEPADLQPAVGEPMERFQAERAELRAEEARQLDEIIADPSTSDEVRGEAQRQKLDRLTWAEQETTIEGILRARGFSEVVATVHRDSVNVLVKTEKLTQSQSAMILELVTRETGQLGGNIKIIPLN